MSDFNYNEEIVVLGSIYATEGFTHDTVVVNPTQHTHQGSVVILGTGDNAGKYLPAKNSDITAANIDKLAVIDDLYFRRHSDAIVNAHPISATVAVRGCIFNKAALKAVTTGSDGTEALTETALKVIKAMGLNKISEVGNVDTTKPLPVYPPAAE